MVDSTASCSYWESARSSAQCTAGPFAQVEKLTRATRSASAIRGPCGAAMHNMSCTGREILGRLDLHQLFGVRAELQCTTGLVQVEKD